MPRRNLRSVATDKVLGSVIENSDGSFTFDRGAADIFKNLRVRMPDSDLGMLLMADGWSNGYLYLSEVIP